MNVDNNIIVPKFARQWAEVSVCLEVGPCRFVAHDIRLLHKHMAETTGNHRHKVPRLTQKIKYVYMYVSIYIYIYICIWKEM